MFRKYLKFDFGFPYENNISRGQIKIIKNLDSHKIQLDWASVFVTRMSRFPCEWYSITTNQDYYKSGFAKNTIGFIISI